MRGFSPNSIRGARGNGFESVGIAQEQDTVHPSVATEIAS